MAIRKATYIIIFFSFLFCLTAESQTASGVVNIYRKVRSVDTAKGIVRLYNASNLTSFIGHSAMLIQMKGATMATSNTSSFGNITATNNAGRFEIGRMCGQLTDSIVFENKLQNFYDTAGGLVQLVFMPIYTNVTITGTLRAAPWDAVADTGGIVAIEASGTVTLNAGISADSAGFRGGALVNQGNNCSNTFAATAYYYSSAGSFPGGNGAKKGEGIADYITNEEYGKGKQTNGGGGGNILNTGGGGGGGYSAGGDGGKKSGGACFSGDAGLGGLGLSFGYSSAQFRMFMGGGGGAGQEDNGVGTPGGNGGGIVYIKASQIVGGGNKISANGNTGYNSLNVTNPYASSSDGGGGGGGGGVVVLNVSGYTTSLVVEARGGNGSNSEYAGSSNCTGPGGGGGGGIVWSNAALPVIVTTNVTGGNNGVILTTCVGAANGATPGAAGVISSTFALPVLKDSSAVCKQILPFRLINSFSGNTSGGIIHLSLELNSRFETQKCILEVSDDGSHFNVLSEQAGNNGLHYYFNAEYKATPSFYRIKIVTITGTTEYSTILYFKPNLPANGIALFPNPMLNKIALHVKMLQAEFADIRVFDMTGRMVYNTQMMLQEGESVYPISLGSLHRGVYSFQLVTRNRNLKKMFVHL